VKEPHLKPLVKVALPTVQVWVVLLPLAVLQLLPPHPLPHLHLPHLHLPHSNQV
jgi:hypothetical protein